MALDRQLTALEARIGYQFQDRELLTRAVTHSSYGDGRRVVRSYERLEFLGDRVLGLLTAQHLFHAFTGPEGELARKLNALVRKETCARAARRFALGEALLLSPAEERQGGREKLSLLGDACEALLAAIYLDGGMGEASKFYDRFWESEHDAIEASSQKDAKTDLQEQASAKGGGLPVYAVIERSGPDHRPLFVIQASVEGFGAALGTGKSKKDAERFAAQHLLEKWKLDDYS